jgi:hypothetical protein
LRCEAYAKSYELKHVVVKMPKVVEDRAKAMIGKGMPKPMAYAISTAAAQKAGKMAKAKKPAGKAKPQMKK